MIKINFTGNYSEIGFQLGKMIKNFFQLPLTSKETIDFMHQCRPYVKQYCPGILDELQGICDATGSDPELLDSFVLCLGKDMIDQSREMIQKGIDFGCSALAISGEHTEMNIPIFARNYDWMESFREFFTVTWTNPKEGISNLSFTDHIVGRYGGMNKEGLTINMNGIPFYQKDWVPGLRMNIITRWILDNFKNLNEAVKFLEKIPHICGHNYLIADKEGNIAKIETTGDDVIISYGDDGFMAITNHFETKSLKKYEYQIVDFSHSQERLNKMNAWYKNKSSNIKITDVKKLLGGHEEGICTHFEFEGETTSTIWSWITEIGTDEILVCDGSPCESIFEKIKF